MKYSVNVVLILTLVTAVLAQDLSCKAKLLDSYVSRMGYYGSRVNGSDSGFYSIIGRFIVARDYISDNPTASMQAINSTFVTYDGVTGKILYGGWVWSLCENGTLYTTGNVNGKKVNCTTGTCPPIEPSAKLVSMLNTLYPIPGVPSKPGSACICQGSVAKGVDNSPTIVNIVWRPLATDELLYSSVLSESQNAEYKFESTRKLTEADRKDFTNVCKKADNNNNNNNKSNEYSDLFGIIRGFLSPIF